MPRINKNNRIDRPKRIPVAEQRNLITVDNLPDNIVSRWVNDTKQGRRIQIFLRAGWEFITDKGVLVGDKRVDSNVEAGQIVSMDAGNGITAYLMGIDKDLYDEDQAKKQELVNEREAAIFAKTKEEGHYGQVEQSVTRIRSST